MREVIGVGERDIEPLRPGVLFHGRYEVLRCLGAGGMGAVYEVSHLETKRRRALKTMLPSLVSDDEMRARFRLEATVAAEIESEHIVEVFDAGVDAATGLPFLVMELLKGHTLAGELARRGSFAAAEVITLLHQASLALDRTHAAGIVHRDLKPENLFLTQRDDGEPRLKLLDFGIAKVVASSTGANTTRNLGTPLYMSPEQIRGDGDIAKAADIYSLGHIAFTLLVGHPYWEAEALGPGNVYALLLKVTQGGRDPATLRAQRAGTSLPAGFDDWFQRATAVEPSARFDTASDLVAALAPVLGIPAPSARRDIAPAAAAAGSGGLASSTEPWGLPVARSATADSTGAISSDPGAFRPRRRHGAVLTAAGLVVVIVAAAAVVGLADKNMRPQDAPTIAADARANGAEAVTTPAVPISTENSTIAPARIAAVAPSAAASANASSAPSEEARVPAAIQQRGSNAGVGSAGSGRWPARPKERRSPATTPASDAPNLAHDPTDTR